MGMLRQIVKGQFQFHEQFWENVSEEGKDFIRRLLVTQPALRMTVEEALLHPWLRIQAKKKEKSLSLSNVLLHTLIAFLFLLVLVCFHFFVLSDHLHLENQLVERLTEMIENIPFPVIVFSDGVFFPSIINYFTQRTPLYNQTTALSRIYPHGIM